MRKLLLMAASLPLVLAVAPRGAVASPDDPVHPSDVIEHDAWTEKTWDHFGHYERGEVSAESWIDLHWPCFDSTDEDQDCTIEDVRGHGLVRKESKVMRTQIDFTRLGRYP